MAKPTKAPTVIAPPITIEEEDNLIHTRITTDERPLRRLTKKIHTYTAVAYPPIVAPLPTTAISVQEARDALLVELGGFALNLQKAAMVCAAERRERASYISERARIERDHDVLKAEIEQLKKGLEHAQIERRRKIEYDQIAERINTLPSREELEHATASLESDMSIIHTEQEAQTSTLNERKRALDAVVDDLQRLHILGKDDLTGSASAKRRRTTTRAATEKGKEKAKGKEKEEKAPDAGGNVEMAIANEGEASATAHAAAKLNPTAEPFKPRGATPAPVVAAVTGDMRAEDAVAGVELSATMEAGHAEEIGSSTAETGKAEGTSGIGAAVAAQRILARTHAGAGMTDTPTTSRDVTPAPTPRRESSRGDVSGGGTDGEGDASEADGEGNANTDGEAHDGTQARATSEEEATLLSGFATDASAHPHSTRQSASEEGEAGEESVLSEEEEGEEEEDIEMGEVSELESNRNGRVSYGRGSSAGANGGRGRGRRKRGGRERVRRANVEREEGEASDESSELTSPPEE